MSEAVKQTTIEAGGLEFLVEYRNFGGDRGPAVRVFGQTDDGRVQILRFDCFDDGPHYHYAPDGMNGVHFLDRDVVPDIVAWTAVQLRRNIKAMVKTAGYSALAESIDAAEIASAADAIHAKIVEFTE